jgi:hypothetical protein
VKFMVLTSGAFAVGQFWLVARSLIRRGSAQPAPAPVAAAPRRQRRGRPTSGAATRTKI